MSEIVFCIPKFNLSNSKTASVINSYFKDVLKEMKEQESEFSNQQIEKVENFLSSLKKISSKNNPFDTLYLSGASEHDTYIINQTNNCIVATDGNFRAFKNLPQTYYRVLLEYNEVFNRFCEFRYGAQTQTLLEIKRDCATVESLQYLFSFDCIRLNVENILNDYPRYITQEMAERSTDWFTGTIQERNDKFKIWLSGENISFDGNLYNHSDNKELVKISVLDFDKEPEKEIKAPKKTRKKTAKK